MAAVQIFSAVFSLLHAYLNLSGWQYLQRKRLVSWILKRIVHRFTYHWYNLYQTQTKLDVYRATCVEDWSHFFIVMFEKIPEKAELVRLSYKKSFGK